MSNDSHPTAPRSWHEHAAHAAPSGHARGQAAQTAPEPELKGKLLNDWQLVKRARFQAASRLERRNRASLFTLSMVALYGGLITVFVLIFKDNLTPHMRSICDWVSVVANWLTLTFSLTEQIKDYSGQSRSLHECARKVNDLRKQLQATPITTSQQLIPFVKAYDGIISECGPNHDTLDYKIARYTSGRAMDGLSMAQTVKKRRLLEVWSFVATYGIYMVMCAAPALAGFLTWLWVPAIAVAGN